MRVPIATLLLVTTVLSLSSCAPSTRDVSKESSVATDSGDKQSVQEDESSAPATKGASQPNLRGTPLALYRRGAIRAIARQFDAEKAEGDPEVKLVLARDGKVLSAEIVESSDPVSDEEALKAIRACSFRKLPAQFEGDSAELRIRFRRVRQIRAQL